MKTIAIEIQMDDTVRDIRKKIRDQTGLDPDQLAFQGSILDDDKAAEEDRNSCKSSNDVSNREKLISNWNLSII